MNPDSITLPGTVHATINVKLATRFNFGNNYLKKDSRLSNAAIFADVLGPKGPAIQDILRGTIISQIYFDLMESSEVIFANFKKRLVDGGIFSQEAADIWVNIKLPVGKTPPTEISVAEKFRDDISHQRLKIWKYYKSLFFALRPPIFRGAFDHVFPGRTPDSYIGQTVQYGETVIHGTDTVAEPGTLRFLQNLNHFCGMPSKVVDDDFDFGDASVNIFEEFIMIVDAICCEIHTFLKWLVSQTWFDFLDSVNTSMKSLLDRLYHSVEHWGDKDGIDILNSNVYEIVRDFNRACHFLNNILVQDPCVITDFETTDDRELAHGEVTYCLAELNEYLEYLRCSHIWVVMGFGTHPETFYHVINPAGFWKNQTDFKHVETPEFWLEKINWESMGAYLKLGWVIFNRVHDHIPFPKSSDTLTQTTPWRCDEQHVINRAIPDLLPSLHKFVTWIQLSFENCFIESVGNDGTIRYNKRKWVLFKSGILNFVSFPKGSSTNPFSPYTTPRTHGVPSLPSPLKASKGEMRATSAFAEADWDDIDGEMPSLHDFTDKQPPRKVPRTGDVAQILQGADSADSAEDSEEDMDDQHFVPGSLNAFVAQKKSGGGNRKQINTSASSGDLQDGLMEIGSSSTGSITVKATSTKSSRIAKRLQPSLSASTGAQSTSSSTSESINTVAKSLVKLGAIPVVPTGAANPKITKQQGKKVGGAVRRQKDS